MAAYDTAMTTPELTPPGSVDEEWSSLGSGYGTNGEVELRRGCDALRKAGGRKKGFVAAIFGR